MTNELLFFISAHRNVRLQKGGLSFPLSLFSSIRTLKRSSPCRPTWPPTYLSASPFISFAIQGCDTQLRNNNAIYSARCRWGKTRKKNINFFI